MDQRHGPWSKKKSLIKCITRMLRYTAAIIWRVGVSSVKVAEICNSCDIFHSEGLTPNQLSKKRVERLKSDSFS